MKRQYSENFPPQEGNPWNHWRGAPQLSQRVLVWWQWLQAHPLRGNLFVCNYGTRHSQSQPQVGRGFWPSLFFSPFFFLVLNPHSSAPSTSETSWVVFFKLRGSFFFSATYLYYQFYSSYISKQEPRFESDFGMSVLLVTQVISYKIDVTNYDFPLYISTVRVVPSQNWKTWNPEPRTWPSFQTLFSFKLNPQKWCDDVTKS